MSKERFVDFDPETGHLSSPPGQVFMELTSRCNLACVHCSKDYGREDEGHPSLDMPLSTIERIMPWLEQTVSFNINMVGEPLIHPRFEDALALLAPVSSKIGFNTNGLRLDRRRCELLVEREVGWVDVSFDGMESNAPIRGVPYAAVRARLAELCAARQRAGARSPGVGIAYTLMRRNLHELPRVLRDLLPLGVKEIHVQPLVIFYETLRGENIYGQVEVRDVLTASSAIAAAHGARLRLFRSRLPGDERYSWQEMDEDDLQLGEHSDVYGCIDPFFEVKVRSTGDVMACSYGLMPGLNVNRMPLDEIWNHSWYRDLRRRLYHRRFEGACARCPYLFGSAATQVDPLRQGVTHSAHARFFEGWRAGGGPPSPEPASEAPFPGLPEVPAHTLYGPGRRPR